MIKTNSIKSFVPLLLASVTLLTNSSVAKAVNFNFSYAPDTTLDQKLGFEMAGQIWSSYLTDDFTTNIYVKIASPDELPTNVIGGALPGIEAEEEYKKYREYVEEDAISTADGIAMSSLETRHDKYDKFTAMYNGKVVEEMNRLNITLANAKAIDLISDNNDLDGYILMSDLSDAPVDWNYDFLNDTVSDGSLDYLSVALHEVGHVMGFVSGVDNPGWLNIMTEHEAKDDLIKRDKIKFFNPLDLYRFTEESATVNAVDISIGGNPFFSINGGATNLGNFATGQATNAGGDGYQASHWERQSNVLGIMDPVLSVGQKRQITDLDLTAFDVIGYDFNDAADLNLTNMYQTALTNANSALVADRSADVEEMIDDSKIYEGRRSGWGQEGFWQEAYFSEFSWQTVDLPADSQSVPEPGSTISIFGLGLLGLGKMLKKRK